MSRLPERSPEAAAIAEFLDSDQRTGAVVRRVAGAGGSSEGDTTDFDIERWLFEISGFSKPDNPVMKQIWRDLGYRTRPEVPRDSGWAHYAVMVQTYVTSLGAFDAYVKEREGGRGKVAVLRRDIAKFETSVFIFKTWVGITTRDVAAVWPVMPEVFWSLRRRVLSGMQRGLEIVKAIVASHRRNLGPAIDDWNRWAPAAERLYDELHDFAWAVHQAGGSPRLLRPIAELERPFPPCPAPQSERRSPGGETVHGPLCKRERDGTHEGGPTTMDPPPPGPAEPNLFWWGGRPWRVPPTAWRLLAYVWQQPRRQAEGLAAQEHVWGVNCAPKENALHRECGRLNHVFEGAGCRLRIRCRGGHVYFTEGSSLIPVVPP